jgi:hypothetical protein
MQRRKEGEVEERGRVRAERREREENDKRHWASVRERESGQRKKNQYC